MQVAIIGYGTIGKALVAQLEQHHVHQVAAIYVRPTKVDQHPLATADLQAILDNPNIEVIIEAINGASAAYEIVKKGMLAKKHIITSNKALMMEYGLTLATLAKQHQVGFAFSATCGGGIPILNNILKYKQTGFKQLIGILNGTTNYMLDSMFTNHLSYQQALIQAQELGYAELDPTADVSGLDTLSKARIACAVGFDQWLDLAATTMEGIEHLTLDDFEVFKQKNQTIRLLATLIKKENQILCMVMPTAVSNDSFFGQCTANKNHIILTDAINDYTLSGYGAGGIETSENIISDLDKMAQSPFSHFNDTIKTDPVQPYRTLFNWILQTDTPNEQCLALANRSSQHQTVVYQFYQKEVSWMMDLAQTVRKTQRVSVVCEGENYEGM